MKTTVDTEKQLLSWYEADFVTDAIFAVNETKAVYKTAKTVVQNRLDSIAATQGSKDFGRWLQRARLRLFKILNDKTSKQYRSALAEELRAVITTVLLSDFYNYPDLAEVLHHLATADNSLSLVKSYDYE
jgi:hypothetical protein